MGPLVPRQSISELSVSTSQQRKLGTDLDPGGTLSRWRREVARLDEARRSYKTTLWKSREVGTYNHYVKNYAVEDRDTTFWR